jgi:endonuclease VIII
VPEGDTVWNTARLVDRALAGGLVTRCDLRVPALATVDLTGATVAGCASRGKHLLLRFTGPAPAPPRSLHSHLRMDGSWRVFGVGETWRGRPAHLIRAVLGTPSAVAVGYHLHELALVPTTEEETLVGHLGPDLLGTAGTPGGWNAEEAVRRLAAQPDVPIAKALLDQRNLAGIGNLYKSEILFLRGVHPETVVRAVDQLPVLVELAHRLLVANRGRWTQATTGSLRRGEETYVYGRGGAPCRRCGAPIRREQPDGERVTYWCPRCQPAPG